jgi:hypothetical protein
VSAVGLFGILLCLGALPFFPPARSVGGVLLFLALLLLHVAGSIAFYQYALTNSADASLYYMDATGLRRAGFTLGTIFTIKLVQFSKSAVGGTFLDYFLLFQAFGFWGLLLLHRCIEYALSKLGDGITRAPYWVLFLPGLHFWTGSIGKDAPLFFAVSLAVYATVRLSTRAPLFALAIGIMVLFRPHIALLATAAFAFSSLFGHKTPTWQKAILLIIAAGAVSVVLGTVERSFGFEVSNPASVGAYLEKQQNAAQRFADAADLQDSSFFIRLFSLLFRPLFLDAGGLFAIVSSFENLAYIFIIGFMIRAWGEGVVLFRTELLYRFSLFFTLALTALLTLMYYNVGLGLRQRTMMMPALLTLFAGQWILRRARLRAGSMPPRPDVPAGVPRTDGPASDPE